MVTCDRAGADGFALPAALLALVIIAALIAGALFMSAEELRAGRSDLASHRALAAAELALDRAIAGWDAQLNVGLRPGQVRVLAASADDRGDSTIVVATRVQDRAVWITSRATSSADGRPIPARVTIAAAMRLLVPVLPLDAALSVGGAAVVVGGTVDGRDTTSDACAADAPRDVAGILAPDTARVCGPDCSTGVPAGVSGTPALASRASLTSDSAGALTLNGLANRATMTLPGGELAPRPAVNGDRCVVDDPLNWGDPARAGPCADHYPVIRVTGDVVLGPGSVGQGLLLIDGSLTVSAGARFDGVVVARNDVRVAGAGAEISGVVLAGDVDGAGGSEVRDGGAIRFAGCVARRSLLAAARLTRAPERWWAELR
jgi:hypothetical protein